MVDTYETSRCVRFSEDKYKMRNLVHVDGNGAGGDEH